MCIVIRADVYLWCCISRLPDGMSCLPLVMLADYGGPSTRTWGRDMTWDRREVEAGGH